MFNAWISVSFRHRLSSIPAWFCHFVLLETAGAAYFYVENDQLVCAGSQRFSFFTVNIELLLLHVCTNLIHIDACFEQPEGRSRVRRSHAHRSLRPQCRGNGLMPTSTVQLGPAPVQMLHHRAPETVACRGRIRHHPVTADSQAYPDGARRHLAEEVSRQRRAWLPQP